MKIREPLLPDEERQPSQHSVLPQSLLMYLYVGHFLARWGARFFSLTTLILLDLFAFGCFTSGLYVMELSNLMILLRGFFFFSFFCFTGNVWVHWNCSCFRYYFLLGVFEFFFQIFVDLVHIFHIILNGLFSHTSGFFITVDLSSEFEFL